MLNKPNDLLLFVLQVRRVALSRPFLLGATSNHGFLICHSLFSKSFRRSNSLFFVLLQFE